MLFCAGEIDGVPGEAAAFDAAGAAGVVGVQRFERIAALERRIFEHAFAAFDQVEQQLGGPVQVQALPAAGQTDETAQAAKQKRGTSKAITAAFQMLDPSQATESEGSSNGHRSFRSR